jgi:hypothetical protein
MKDSMSPAYSRYSIIAIQKQITFILTLIKEVSREGVNKKLILHIALVQQYYIL